MTKKNILNLCEMSDEDTKYLNKLYTQYKAEYVKMLDKLSRGKNIIYWWVTHLSSRYYLLSNAYKNICIALLGIERLRTNAQTRMVYCPSEEIATVIRSVISSKNICFKVPSKKKKITLVEQTFHYISYIMKEITEYKKIRNVLQTNSKYQLKKSEEIVLIDTYVKASDVTNTCYRERYFCNILDYTNEKIYFMPTLYLNTRAKSDILVKKLIANSKYRYIFKEQFLKKWDVFKLLPYPLFCAMFCIQKKYFCNIDVTPIVNRDLVDNIVSSNSIEGMLKYWAIKRIKKRGIAIKRLIGWYEGQPSSNGLFLGYRREYPKEESIGYLGYAIDKNSISISPNIMQMKYLAVPQKMSVMAECFKNIPQQFVHDIEVDIVPALRIQGINRCDSEWVENKNTILIALSYEMISACQILKWIKYIDKFLKQNNIILHIKNHPCNRNMMLKQYGVQKLECDYVFIDGDFDDAVSRSNFVITAHSTSGYETALYGKPIIFLNFPGELDINYMPEEWEGIRYKVIYNVQELKEAIIEYINCRLNKLDFENEQYYCTISQETVGRLFK